MVRQSLILTDPSQALTGTVWLNPMIPGRAPFTAGVTANRPEEEENLIPAKDQQCWSYPIMDNHLQHVRTQSPVKALYLTQIFVPLYKMCI